MKNINSYSIRLTDTNGVFNDTLTLYRKAVMFFVEVINTEWDTFKDYKSPNDAVAPCEHMTVETKRSISPKYNFTTKFYKFPSYLRRAAIAEAFGMVKSYHSNLNNWINTPKSGRGKKPRLADAADVFPCLYKGNCFVRTGEYTAKVKAYIRNTWDWVTVSLRKTDVDYITRHCSLRKQLSPTLVKRHKVWELVFPFEHTSTLPDTPIEEQRIISVDMGLINACTCSVMESDGTVVGRHFLKLSAEYDSLRHALNNIKFSQQHGSRKMPRKWAKVRNINTDISRKTANFITNLAVQYNADAVVMERLNVRGKKKGGRKQRLHHWRCQYVQQLVEHKCHSLGIRISHVCACNTSRLAFDGSGNVLRGKYSERTCGNYSLCEFSNGKLYNCDLNASYNIGARYYIREILRSIPEEVRLAAEAKVPSLLLRSTCCLSDLKGLCGCVNAFGMTLTACSVGSVKLSDSHSRETITDDNTPVMAVGSTRL